MAKSEKDYTVVELQARWDKIRIANLYDTLDKMGYPNQCLDLGIRPLFPHQHLAGVAIPCRGGRDPRTREQFKQESKGTENLLSVKDLVFPGCVVVIDGGGERWTGKFGEMTSWNIKQAGARGLLIDGCIRDKLGLEVIPDFVVCARDTSPVESYKNWRLHEINTTIALPGTLTSQITVRPGDWIIGGEDGVIVVPQEIAMEALVKAEEIERREQGMREDMAAGMLFEDAYKKWGRA